MRKNKLTAQTEWKKRIKKYRIRIVLCGGLILSAYLIPQLTQAQYKWTLNGYSTLQAKSYYFASDKLRDEKNDMVYPISGWDGKTQTLPINIRNYENALLANANGEDAEYELTWSITTNRSKGSSGENYTLTMNSHNCPDGATENKDSNNNLTSISSTIKGTGNPKKDSYEFSINPPDLDHLLKDGESVIVEINAKNTSTTGNNYSKSLKATFVYKVSTMDEYVTGFNIEEDTQYGNNAKLKLRTGTLPDLNAQRQTVVVWWDTSKLQVNTFNYVFMNASAAGGYTQNINGSKYNVLKLTELGSNASRDLDFRKLGDDAGEKWFGPDSAHIGKNITFEQAEKEDEIKYIGYYIEVATTTEGQ